jgi:hypothetical protein
MGKIAEKVCEAEWLYDGVLKKTVQIYKLNYDYYYDLDEGFNDEGEVPELNENGEQYAVFNDSPKFDGNSPFPFYTTLNFNDAKSYTEKILNQKLSWNFE